MTIIENRQCSQAVDKKSVRNARVTAGMESAGAGHAGSHGGPTG